MREVFAWFPDIDGSVESTPLVKVVQFGDGYESRISNTIHPAAEAWRVRFTRPHPEVIAIKNFLIAHAGVRAFTWTTPEGRTGAFKCPTWNTERRKGISVLNCEFKEVFEA